ncbi:MAG: ZIP family metal transporter [Acholeplasma sp.]|nr:ZIP family metal transporter [Acholeplasma sp.]
MIDYLLGIDPWLLALLGGLFTWSLTALGASLVFFFKSINRNIYNMMLGFAAGVMIAASVWSLLIPAIGMAEEQGAIPWVVASVGFFVGTLFLFAFDKIIPHIHFGDKGLREGIRVPLPRSVLLVFSITLHNIPEGLAVGVAFGAIGLVGDPNLALMAAIAVAIGIGIQNFPEGAAVSIPLRHEGNSRTKAFLYGQASALVEPVAAVIGALLVTAVSSFLPYALAFAAGAMIYVVVEELIPEASEKSMENQEHVATFGFILGFIIMMVLDVALG